VYAISTRNGRLLARIPVGAGPHGLCVWPQPGRYSLGHTGVLRWPRVLWRLRSWSCSRPDAAAATSRARRRGTGSLTRSARAVTRWRGTSAARSAATSFLHTSRRKMSRASPAW